MHIKLDTRQCAIATSLYYSCLHAVSCSCYQISDIDHRVCTSWWKALKLLSWLQFVLRCNVSKMFYLVKKREVFEWCFRILFQLFQLRGATRDQIRSFFEHCSKRGGGSKPCPKILEQILYDFKGILAT